MTTLEKIRAEIEETQENTIDWSRSVGLIDALDIIDKYAEQQEPCDDVVSRQAVVNAIKYAQVNFTINSTINFANYTKEVQAIVDNILSAQIKAINKLPYVTPQPKVGHWIRIKAYEKWGCSECNTFFRFTFKEHEYCPNCGAKMVEPQESEPQERSDKE